MHPLDLSSPVISIKSTQARKTEQRVKDKQYFFGHKREHTMSRNEHRQWPSDHDADIQAFY